LVTNGAKLKKVGVEKWIYLDLVYSIVSDERALDDQSFREVPDSKSVLSLDPNRYQVAVII
jgi:hypothetical protein